MAIYASGPSKTPAKNKITDYTAGPWVIADSINAATVHCGKTEVMIADCRNLAIYEQCSANARLISVAPELLEALEALVLDESKEYIPTRLWNAARVAIAKAKGETAVLYL